MDIQELTNTAKKMVAQDKGLLAMDESINTCNKRFAVLGISSAVESRRAYRELILTTPSLNAYISGVILSDETIRQEKLDGTSFMKLIDDAGIIAGIKVDKGTVAMPNHDGERITEGLDNLSERLKEYYAMGARFAKWRAVITIGDGIPTDACIESNTHALAIYAAFCQEAGLVPIVEPEVLMEGDHTLNQCKEATEKVLRSLFNQLYIHGVVLEGLFLKPNMVVPGLNCKQQESIQEVAEATVNCFLNCVPAAVAGIVLLSGGQSSKLATGRLNAMNQKFGFKLPWPLSFSFGRALQEPALEIWGGENIHVDAAQKALLFRAQRNWLANRGEYSAVEDIKHDLESNVTVSK